jgi:hypothetical protein
MMATEWRVKGTELANCNCAYGCPCQFMGLPTHGDCRAAVGYEIEAGHFGDVRLDGLRAVTLYSWPGAVHEGNGTMQLVIDERANAAQREALVKILSGEETDEMATMWWVFSAMSPNKLEPLYRPIEFAVDVAARRGHFRVPGLVETIAEPIRNPVTGAEHRVSVHMPGGFEYHAAEFGSAATTAQAAVPLEGLTGSHAHFVHLHLSNRGVVA